MMGDEFDVDAMLEAAYDNNKSSHSSSSRDKDRYHSNGKRRSPNMDEEEYGPKAPRKSRDDKEERKRSRDEVSSSSSRSRRSSRERDERKKEKRRSRSRSRDRVRRDGGSSRDRERRRSRERGPPISLIVERKRSRSRSREKRGGGGGRRGSTPPRLRLGPKRSRSPLTLEEAPLGPEERDARTVFCMQLSNRIRARDLEDFFSSVGKVRDVRMITCNKTRRFKGIAYIEFKDIESVALALGLNGQKLLGVPILVQPSQAEKNRAGQFAKAGQLVSSLSTAAPGPMKLYIGSLHFNITEEMLRGIFEPFGRIDEILLMKDPETGRSKGFGFLTFSEGEDAKKALEQLNGFEIAGRPMKVGYVTDKPETTFYHNPQALLDTDEMDRAGVNLGVTGRLQLMAKLAEGTDLKLPEAATTALSMQQLPYQQTSPVSMTQVQQAIPAIATQCFMLSNMFDPTQEMGNMSFEQELRDEVLEACAPHGGVVHIYVDMSTPSGNVYLKCPSVPAAVATVTNLHGRWFGGRVITAAYVPLLNYHSLFPDAMGAMTLLRPSKK